MSSRRCGMCSFILMGGPEMAPQPPQRSGRPGQAVAPLDPPRWVLRLGLLLTLVLGLASSARADQAADIVAEADRFRRPAVSFVWKITITSQEAKKAPSVDGFEVFVKGGGRTFVKFAAPPRNVGRSLLALGRDLWIYLPDAGKPVRIPLSQRLVGQVANGDIARADYAGDYDATLLGEESVDGVACWRRRCCWPSPRPRAPTRPSHRTGSRPCGCAAGWPRNSRTVCTIPATSASSRRSAGSRPSTPCPRR